MPRVRTRKTREQMMKKVESFPWVLSPRVPRFQARLPARVPKEADRFSHAAPHQYHTRQNDWP